MSNASPDLARLAAKLEAAAQKSAEGRLAGLRGAMVARRRRQQ
jgi:hypothetical protein